MPDFNEKARLPVRPLSYNNHELAMPKEIIIDFEKYVIYTVDDSGTLHNLSVSPDTLQTIQNYIKNNPSIITEALILDEATGEYISIEESINNILRALDSIPTEGISIDNTLTKSGSAADSAVVGSEIKKINETINSLPKSDHNHETSDINGLDDTLNRSLRVTLNPDKTAGTVENIESIESIYFPQRLTTPKEFTALKLNLRDGEGENDITTITNVMRIEYNSTNKYRKIIVGNSNCNALYFPQPIVLSPNQYGTKLPTSGIDGQLFFKIIEE